MGVDLEIEIIPDKNISWEKLHLRLYLMGMGKDIVKKKKNTLQTQ